MSARRGFLRPFLRTGQMEETNPIARDRAWLRGAEGGIITSSWMTWTRTWSVRTSARTGVCVCAETRVVFGRDRRTCSGKNVPNKLRLVSRRWLKLLSVAVLGGRRRCATSSRAMSQLPELAPPATPEAAKSAPEERGSPRHQNLGGSCAKATPIQPNLQTSRGWQRRRAMALAGHPWKESHWRPRAGADLSDSFAAALLGWQTVMQT